MFEFKRKRKIINKSLLSEVAMIEQGGDFGNKANRRGVQVYTASQLRGVAGRDKEGQIIRGNVETPYFFLTIEERLAIFRQSTPVFGIVTRRMNRISSLKWKITREKNKEDEKALQLKTMRDLYKEYENQTDLKYVTARVLAAQQVLRDLPDCLPDLSNFDKSLLRWSKAIANATNTKCDEIKCWLEQPNIEDKWEDFSKKWVFDLLVHGTACLFKEQQNGKIENIYILPGGSVLPLKDKYIGGGQAYIQLLQAEQPLIYYSDEVSFVNYCPSSARAYGFIPMEALVNKITENLLFDKLMADQADGTKPPEKMIIINDAAPFGQLGEDYNVVPINESEQKRIETKINQPRKNALMTFSGNGVTVVDLSRENTMAFQSQRQKDILSDVALCFSASNIEMNLTGSESTSGRETSESQLTLIQDTGIFPLTQKMESQINYDILPYRFGYGYKMEYDTERSESEQVELETKRAQNGTYTINEIRAKRNDDPVDWGNEAPKAQQETENNPMAVKPI
jgi:hypothetical protein